jgi:hypothetical protein
MNAAAPSAAAAAAAAERVAFMAALQQSAGNLAASSCLPQPAASGPGAMFGGMSPGSALPLTNPALHATALAQLQMAQGMNAAAQ